MRKLILFLTVCLTCTIWVCAEGTGNITGNGDETSSATEHGSWSVGNYGVRVTIVEKNTLALMGTQDFTNATTVLENYEEEVYHFGKKSKIAYRYDFTLYGESGGYDYYELAGMPVIFDGDGNTNVSAVRTFFTSDDTVRSITATMGLDYDEIVAGDYKLLIEPIAYYTYEDVFYATTAHEAALLDLAVGDNLLRTWMGKITHQNLPLSMYLEYTDLDLGFYRWSGGTSGKQSDSNILSYLGMGIISFSDITETEPSDSEYDYEFRTDTDVIIAFNAYSREEVNPDDNAYLDVWIDGVKYSKAYICPAGGSTLVWIKWHTPSEPCVVDIVVDSDEVSTRMTMTANITAIPYIEPPDPVYEDTNPGIDWDDLSAPDYGSVTSTYWMECTTYWVHEPSTHYEVTLLGTITWTCSLYTCDCPRDHGYWSFEYTTYTADLMVDYEICPDEQVPTATKQGGQWVMGSGYGLNVNCETKVLACTGVDDYDFTPVQNIVTLYPEFEYQSYDRLMVTDRDTTSDYTADWTLQDNRYSYYSNPVHFTPLWYPDGDYTVGAVVLDAWTPGGMLYTTVEDSLEIWMTCLDDWYIHIVE